jgi:hypothetical protein
MAPVRPGDGGGARLVLQRCLGVRLEWHQRLEVEALQAAGRNAHAICADSIEMVPLQVGACVRAADGIGTAIQRIGEQPHLRTCTGTVPHM